MWHTIRDTWYVTHNMWYVICDTWYTLHNKAKVLGGSFCVLEDVWGVYSTTQGIQITWHTIRYVLSRTTTCTRQAAVRYSIGHRGLGGSLCVLQDVCGGYSTTHTTHNTTQHNTHNTLRIATCYDKQLRYSIGHRGLGGSFCVLQDVCNQWAWGRWWGPLYANSNQC